ncbi:roundabout homolog 1-like isoform X2 [Clytia hemisphaerica]|uniref:Uncharacterized protein n=1 Tax=Clytia hemisphaerica TaxID=252671 RepID=A0A7M5XKR5_9CNID
MNNYIKLLIFISFVLTKGQDTDNISNRFRYSPQNATVEMHKIHIMKCRPPNSYPNATIEWYHNDVLVQPKQYQIDIFDLNGDSHIQFGRITWEERGKYTCHASNSEGTKKSEPAYLTVKVIKPDLYSHWTTVEAYVGKTLQLQCFNKFKPEPDRTWMKREGDMPESSRIGYQYDKSVMIINGAKISDSGEYVCTGENEAGKQSIIVKVIVYEKPTFLIQPTDMTIGRGQTATFQCQVKGGKSPTIEWFYNTKAYSQKFQSGNVIVTKDNDLVISNVDTFGQQSVVCTYRDSISRNQDKKFSPKVFLKVTSSVNPPPSVQVLTEVKKTEKSDLTLPCVVRTSAGEQASIKWLTASDNREVDTGANTVWITAGINSANLTIQGLLTSDSGGYRCVAETPSGTISNITMLQVNALLSEKPPKITNLNSVGTSATSITLSWDRPKTAILLPITSYFLKVKNTGTLETVERFAAGSATKYVVQSLEPDSTYLITINAINKVGNGVAANFPFTDTLDANVTPDPSGAEDKLEDVNLGISLGTVTTSTIEVRWNKVSANRITGYIVMHREVSKSAFIESEEITPTKTSLVLYGLKANTEYAIKVKAVSSKHQKESSLKTGKTLNRLPPVAKKVYIEKYSASDMIVFWKISSEDLDLVDTVEITIQQSDTSSSGNKVPFAKVTLPKTSKKKLFENIDNTKIYYVVVLLKTVDGKTGKSTEIPAPWARLAVGEKTPDFDAVIPGGEKEEENSLGDIVKEPWFIATIGVFVWLILLVIVIFICCRKRKKNHQFRGSSSTYESRGLLPTHGTLDYPNTSLTRTRMSEQHSEHYYNMHKKKKSKFCSCCCDGTDSINSLDDNFPNRVHIKPIHHPTMRQESFEMSHKPDGLGMNIHKENNVGIAMKNGYMVGAPLNNERNYRQNSIDNRQYNDRPNPIAYRGGSIDNPSIQGSGSMPRRNPDPKYQSDSVERRLGEIVRTNKALETSDVNVLANNQQASWKRDKPHKDSPTLSPKPPGENTLRRQGKFKPLPQLEVLTWADGLPATPQNDDASPPGSPKTDNTRADSRMSHGGSSNSLNKYSSHRRRRNSNASSMMSSELYQSEMDPSGYSDIVSDKKKKKEKAIPPPIHFDGLTSDILLQWAESVTNSSPSSSGSSSPSRLSGISSEGSLYTDEDFAQAVAAVAECGGFNMDYDYNLPGMNPNLTPQQVPLSATRNSKMNKIDQVLEQRRKNLNTPASSQKQGAAPTPPSFVPQISMSNYLTGSSKGHQSANGKPHRPKDRGPAPARYGTGLDDVDSVSSSSSKPLTMSNLMKHDSSLDRGKKESNKPLTMSNLRQHDSSLDRERRVKPQQTPSAPPASYGKPPPYESNHNTRVDPLLPEAPSLVTSALERNESMNSNSKDSVNSSIKHDSEVENNLGTSERKQARKGKKYYANHRDPKSSTSTVNTVRSSPDYDDDDYEADC